MIGAPRRLVAEPWARLPQHWHWDGAPNDWTEATRPGQRLHSFLESPVFAPDGSLLLVDVPYGRIFRIDREGGWDLALAYDGQPHALRALPDGRWAIADYRHGLLSCALDGRAPQVLCDRVNTEAFRGLSDLCVASSGDIWFTDCGRSSLTDPSGRLFCLRAGGRLELALSNGPYPNGVALSPDGDRVYVAMTRANAVWALRAQAADPVPPMVGVFLQLSGGLGPDGLAVDARGRLAVAQAQAGRAWLFDPLGDLLAEIRTPGGSWTTAVAFTPGGDALMITEAQSGTVYRVALDDLPEISP